MIRESEKRTSDPAYTVDLTVIAPCLNEEENVDILVKRTLAVFDSMGVAGQLVLIDDGSTDWTWEKICRSYRADDRIRGIQHPRNLGMEAAWQSGLNAARGKLVCLIDADLQNRPEDIRLLYETYQGNPCDMVQAVRHPGEGGRRCLVFSRGLNLLLNAIFRMRSRDNKSGFVLCSREVLADILQHRYRYRYFQALLGVATHLRGHRIKEVDTVFDARTRGTSFLNRFPLIVSLRLFWELVKFRAETWLPSASSAKSARDLWSRSLPVGRASARNT